MTKICYCILENLIFASNKQQNNIGGVLRSGKGKP